MPYQNLKMLGLEDQALKLASKLSDGTATAAWRLELRAQMVGHRVYGRNEPRKLRSKYRRVFDIFRAFKPEQTIITVTGDVLRL